MKPTFEDIYKATLEELGINENAFKKAGKSRLALFVRARQMMCYVAREKGYDTIFIGKQLGITHSSVIYHHKTAQAHITWERDYSKSISNIISSLGMSPTEHTVGGWLTRDKGYGEYLNFTSGEKPERDEHFDLWIIKGESTMCDVPKDMFPQITWESEPQECEMTLRLKKYGE